MLSVYRFVRGARTMNCDEIGLRYGGVKTMRGL